MVAGLSSMVPPGVTAVVEALPQPAVVLDRERRVCYANAAWRARFPSMEPSPCWALLRGGHEPCGECPALEVQAGAAPRACRFDRGGVRYGLRLAQVTDDLLLGTLAEASPATRFPGDDRDLLQTILDSASDAVIACDRDHVVEFVNRTLVERSGVPAAALVGRNFRTFYPPVPGLSWEEVSARVLEGGEVVRLQNVEYHHSVTGLPVWVNLVFAPRRNASGAIVGSVTTVTYLTAEHRLAQLLAESEQRYQGLFESAPVGLVIIGADRCLRLVNPAATSLFGDRGDMTGRRFEDFVAPGDRARMLAAFGRVMETGQRRVGGNEFAITTAAGERRLVHVRTSDVVYRDERCLQVVLIDVTEQHRLQEELDRTARLADLGILAAGVAHEFNNVLAAIQGRSEIIERCAGRDPGLVAECARALVRLSLRGAEIVEQIYSLAATRPLRPAAVRLEDLAEEALGALAPRLVDEQITVVRDYAARGAVWADSGQVQQLVLNLLQNARDAIRPLRQGTIRVLTRDLPDGVLLAIADSGIGMDEATRRRLFESFFTTKEDEARPGDLTAGLGLGLGLAIVQGVVRAHRGRIEVQSTPGQGTRIDVILPAATGEPAPPRFASPPAGVARPLRVVVIDDDHDVTEMIILALETRGCSGVAITDPRQAVAACAEAAADVILIDRVLPPLDGLDVLRELRRRGVTAPAVLLSGRRAEEDAALLEALGVRRRLTKPVRLVELFAAVDAAAGGAGPPAGGGEGG
jgi:two-component system cell cycle sensor histidine kinase/response regulator CckA